MKQAAGSVPPPDATTIATTPTSEAALSLETAWAVRIRPYLEMSVAGYIAAGLELIEAKRALKKQRGSFIHMVEVELGENIDAAEKWMRIARNPYLADSANLRNLPTAWTTLYILSSLKADVLEELVQAGRLHPALTGEEAQTLVGLVHRASNLIRGQDGEGRGEDHGDEDRGGDGRGGVAHDIDRDPAKAASAQAVTVGPDSRCELDRKLARAEELECQARFWEIQRSGLESEIQELKARLDETNVPHQRRLFRQALRSLQQAESSGIDEKDRRSLRASATTDFIELVRSAVRDGLNLNRLDIFCRPELH